MSSKFKSCLAKCTIVFSVWPIISQYFIFMFDSILSGMFNQSKWYESSQPVWKHVMAHNPDLWIWLGDGKLYLSGRRSIQNTFLGAKAGSFCRDQGICYYVLLSPFVYI